MRPVRWYCPPGVPKPPHAIIPGELQCLPEAGPPGAPPGGRCYGAPVEPGEEGWQRHPAGHWFNFAGASPAILIRLQTDPRILEWVEVAGSDPTHLWRVPKLVEPVLGDDGEILLFKSALDNVWTPAGWSLPPAMQDLQRRLLGLCHGIGTDKIRLDAPEAVGMALDVLGQGHEFDVYEVAAAGWVTEVLVIRALLAGCGMRDQAAEAFA